jgi:putative transposase
MARARRPNFPFAVYHVTMRGNDRREIFRDDVDREMMLHLFGEAVPRFQLEVFSFCLMSNHYHMFLRTPEGNLSPAFHWINAVYTQRFNRRHGRCGHVFQGRFKSVIVTRDAHWHHLSIYIHLNPVRAGMVTDPADHPWSSYRDYIQQAPRYRWLSPAPILAGFGAQPAVQRKQYRKQTLSLARQEPIFWHNLIQDILATGAQAAKSSTTKARQPAAAGTESPRRSAILPRGRCRPELELERVAAVFEVTQEDLLRQHRHFPARLAAYHHLVHHCGLGVRETAEIFGLKPNTISSGLQTLQKLLPTQPELRRKLSQLPSTPSLDPS